MEYEALIERVTNRVLEQITDKDESIIVKDFTIDKLSQILGKCTDNEAKSIQKAIFSGKKVIIPHDEVELYRYKNTAPPAFYKYFEAKLQILIDSGVVVDRQTEFNDCVLKKKVVTERDIIELTSKNLRELKIPQTAILTMLAREMCDEQKIKITRIKI